MLRLVLPVVAFAMLAGCATAPQPVVDHRAEALKQIRAAEDAAIRAFGKRDADESTSFYATDAALMLPNMQVVEGAGIKPVLKEMMADPNFSMTFDTAKVEASTSGELGYTRGAYVLTTTDPKSKKVMRESGKYLTVYRKQPDGSWKNIDDINNPDGPAVALGAAKH
jgi:ketosteroid isomerase-like protein